MGLKEYVAEAVRLWALESGIAEDSSEARHVAAIMQAAAATVDPRLQERSRAS